MVNPTRDVLLDMLGDELVALQEGNVVLHSLLEAGISN